MSRKHILVVDDEILIAFDIEATLMMQGHQVSTATSTAEALAVLDRGGVDLAVIDYQLKEGGCDQLAMRLNAEGVPFVVCSGVACLQELGGLFAEAPFLPKPFTSTDLLELVGNIAPTRSANATN